MWREAWCVCPAFAAQGQCFWILNTQGTQRAEIVILLAVIFNTFTVFPTSYFFFSAPYFLPVRSVPCQQACISSLLIKNS